MKANKRYKIKEDALGKTWALPISITYVRKTN